MSCACLFDARCCRLALMLTWGLLGLACLCPASAVAMPRSPQELRSVFDQLIKTPVKHGNIPSLMRPSFISVNDAANVMESGDQVFLVAFPGGIRMYPQKLMVWHEVVNEIIDGDGYCVTYSPIAGCLAAYATRLDQINLIFDAEGRLYNNNTVLVDRNTGSLWLQIAGIAFDGPLTGRGLKQVPVLWTDWVHARKAFPQAQVMAQPKASRTYGRDPYGSYSTGGTYYQDDDIIYPLTSPRDKRMKPKTRIMGLELDTAVLAIDVNYVRRKGCVNFFVGPFPLLAVYDPLLDSVRVFNRTVWERPALFRMEKGQLVDIDSESQWNMDGQATTGNLQGVTMEPLFGIYAFWFAWAAVNPETFTVPGPTVVPDSALVKGSLDTAKP